MVRIGHIGSRERPRIATRMAYLRPKDRLGRVQRAIQRVLLIRDNKPTSTSQFLQYSHVRRLWEGRTSRMEMHTYRYSIRRAAEGLGLVRVGRGGQRGRPILWQLRVQHDCDIDE